MSVRSIDLNDQTKIPQLGFGVFLVPPADTKEAVLNAFEVGYRHIDTARIYDNEEGVGAAITHSGIAREDLFITTKVWNDDQGYDSTLKAFETSMAKLGLEYLDLYLIHWPAPAQDRIVETWKALEKLHSDGRVRAIGVSNFRIEDFEKLRAAGLSTPSINQVEVHPYLTNSELRSYHEAHGIVTEAWSPIARGRVLDDPVLREIAANHDRTVAQVVLAWHLALNHVIIPKSVTPARIRENFEISDILLSPDEIAAITGLDKGERVGPDPATFNP